MGNCGHLQPDTRVYSRATGGPAAHHRPDKAGLLRGAANRQVIDFQRRLAYAYRQTSDPLPQTPPRYPAMSLPTMEICCASFHVLDPINVAPFTGVVILTVFNQIRFRGREHKLAGR